MTNQLAATTPLPPVARVRRALLPALTLSLCVTACCAMLALPLHALVGVRYAIVFIVLRWLVVAALLLAPLLHQLLVRATRSRGGLPSVLATPLPALLMTCESIAIDIVSAQLH